MAQINRSPKTYDVCVIGSGAGGGMAAKILTEGGLNVVMLEAGPQIYPEKDYKMLMWPYELPHRGAGVGGRASENFSEFLAPNGAWQIEGEPYTSAPGANFQWFRSRIVGGRTNHWGRIALRFAPVDFQSKTRDGLGDDWPITYDDLAPYYDKVESYIGVFGTKENVSSAPDGVFLPPPKPRCTEILIKKACDKLNITCIPCAPGDSDQSAQRPLALPLLRAVRSRLHHGFQFQFQPGADCRRRWPPESSRSLPERWPAKSSLARTAKPKPSPTLIKPRAPKSACTRKLSWWRPVRANPRGCC